MFRMPPEGDIETDVRAKELPWVAALEPLVGHFRLPSVTDLLVKDAELVTDAVPDSRNFERRQRIQITGGQPPQPPIAEPGFLLDRQQGIEVLAE